MDETYLSLGGMFASAFISSTLAPGGSEAVLAYLVAHGGYSIVQLVTVASIGNTLGALTTWMLGLWAAKKYPADTVLSDKRQKAVDWVRRYGYWSLLLSWLPLVGDGLCFACGWLKLAFVPACLAILVGKAARYAVIALAFNP